jgi:hypothetical protein
MKECTRTLDGGKQKENKIKRVKERVEGKGIRS